MRVNTKKPYNSTTEFLQIYHVPKIIKIGHISSDFKNQKGWRFMGICSKLSWGKHKDITVWLATIRIDSQKSIYKRVLSNRLSAKLSRQ